MKITGHKTDVMFERYNTVDMEDAQLAMKLYEEYVSRQKITSTLLQDFPKLLLHFIRLVSNALTDSPLNFKVKYITNKSPFLSVTPSF